MMEYDNRGRLVVEEVSFGKSKTKTSYQYSGDSPIPRRAASQSVFDRLERNATFQQGN